MYPRLLHIYGPVWIQSYGVMLAIGFFVFLLFTLRHPLRKNLIQYDVYINLLFTSILGGIIGGRLLHLIIYPQDFADNWIEIFYPWVGGLVALGAIIGVITTASVYLYWHHIPIMPILDLAAIYAPLMQAISRMGCLLAGCCYGAPTTVWWAIIFTNPDAQAPLYIPLHPTQLYLALASFMIFLIQWGISGFLLKRTGALFCMFLILENTSRFLIDFWRGDRHPIFIHSLSGQWDISYIQMWSALGFGLSILGFVWFLVKDNRR